jgi:hypothetical protein
MRSTASARAIARLLTVCAVLAGLFFMHGLPAQACSGGTGGMSAMTATSTAGHQDGITLGAGSAHREMVATVTAAAGHGTACVFTPAPRGLDALLALLLFAATVALASAQRLPNFGGHRISHRAPPPIGATLLTALCVSRT